jgi:potassium-transporting ATPase KdpC subunit
MRAGMISERRLPTYKIALTAIAPTGLASVRFSHHANGSVIEKGGTVIGSELIGQTSPTTNISMAAPRQPRIRTPTTRQKRFPAPYGAANSDGSNLGPTSQVLIDRVKDDAEKLKADHPSTPIPVDLVTTSGSPLIPTSPRPPPFSRCLEWQRARNLPPDKVHALVVEMTPGPVSRHPRREAGQCPCAQSSPRSAAMT